MLTNKERFMNVLSFKSFDRVPNFEIGAWEQTTQRWEMEGLPTGLNTGNFFGGNEYFKLEGIDCLNLDALVPYPPRADRIIEEDDRYVLFSDAFGRVRQALKEGTVGGTRMSMDHYIRFPVTNRQSFLDIKQGYSGDFHERYPKNWEELKEKARKTTNPLTLLDPMQGTFGFYSMLRNWMGTEGVSYLIYDDPSLVEECIEFLCDYIIRLLTKALTEMHFDLVYIHEDMCYNAGPLVSPKTFRSMFLPYYKKFVDCLKSNGVRIVLVDTDGNFDKLIPCFLEAGVDGFGPIEIAAGMDPVRLRKEYGKSLCMLGGIDKREVAKGKGEIEAELRRRILPILSQGGFIPSIDHSIPPSVSLENFCYYIEMKRKILNG
jgi:hypothetical protein